MANNIKEAMIKYIQSIEIIPLLEALRGFTFIRRGAGYCCEQHENLAIKDDGFSWYWHSKGVDGCGVLDYLIKAENMTFDEAIKALADMDVGEPPVC